MLEQYTQGKRASQICNCGIRMAVMERSVRILGIAEWEDVEKQEF